MQSNRFQHGYSCGGGHLREARLERELHIPVGLGAGGGGPRGAQEAQSASAPAQCAQFSQSAPEGLAKDVYVHSVVLGQSLDNAFKYGTEGQEGTLLLGRVDNEGALLVTVRPAHPTSPPAGRSCWSFCPKHRTASHGPSKAPPRT